MISAVTAADDAVLGDPLAEPDPFRLRLLDGLAPMLAKFDREGAFGASGPSAKSSETEGRNAPDQLMDLADLVTEMKLVKHPYRAGVKAQRGVEF